MAGQCTEWCSGYIDASLSPGRGFEQTFYSKFPCGSVLLLNKILLFAYVKVTYVHTVSTVRFSIHYQPYKFTHQIQSTSSSISSKRLSYELSAS